MNAPDLTHSAKHGKAHKLKVMQKASNAFSKLLTVHCFDLSGRSPTALKRPDRSKQCHCLQANLFINVVAPHEFIFDASSANVKLKLSDDKKSVYYGGAQSSSPKSPTRFSFAINILGNRAFYSGR